MGIAGLVLVAAMAQVPSWPAEYWRGTYHTEPDVDITAFAELVDRAGRVVGEVTLVQLPNGLLVHVKVFGLPPGVHGFHVHEVGQCQPSFAWAGGHYNPLKRNHGYKNPFGPHAGDLPNLFIPESGSTETEFFTRQLSLHGGAPLYSAPPLFDADSSAFIVHAFPDDYRTDPTGASGPPIACGVVKQ